MRSGAKYECVAGAESHDAVEQPIFVIAGRPGPMPGHSMSASKMAL